MLKRLINKLKNIKARYILLMTVFFSILLTELLLSVIWSIFHGTVTYAFIVTGALASSIVALTVSFILLSLVRHLQKEEKNLLESKKTLKLLVEIALDAVVMIDSKGIITGWNGQAQNIFGWSQEEAIGAQLTDTIIPPAHQAAHVAGLTRFLTTGEEVILNRRVEITALRRDGREIPIELAIVPLKTGGGYLFSAFIRDISESKAAEAELKLKQGQLEKLNKELNQLVKEEVAKSREKDQLMLRQGRFAAMGEMIGNIAHQWRQPLNSVAIIIQDLRDIHAGGGLTTAYLEKKTQKSMEIVQHMSKTIDDFKNFFRTEKEKQRFNLKPVIEKALSITALHIKSSSIEIETDMESDLIVEGHQNEYIQTLMNIISNAKDALRESGKKNARIKIRAFREDGNTVVTITDNAGGIPEDIKDRIFDPYFTTKEKGTGIGLYMAKMLIEDSMEGKLTVNKTTGEAEFAIIMPLAKGIRP